MSPDVRHLLSCLREDPVAHASVISFVKDNVIRNISRLETGWLIRGTSDRDWVYLVCRNPRELTALVKHLTPGDRCFGAVPDWMMSTLTKDRTLAWDLLLTRYMLPDSVPIPYPAHATRPLTPNDAETIYANSDYRDFLSVDYIAQRIRKGPGRGIEHGGQLVAWGLTQDDGAMGFLHVVPERRKLGYGRSITGSLIRDIRTAGRTPFAYIEPDNSRSIGLVEGLGFVGHGNYHWFELSDAL